MQPGNIVRLRKNLPQILLQTGYDLKTIMALDGLIGTEQVIQEIRQDSTSSFPRTFVLLDTCIEIPIECCQLIKSRK